MELKYILCRRLTFCRFTHSLWKHENIPIREESVFRYSKRNCSPSHQDHYLMELYYRAIIDLCKKYLGSFIMLCERTFVLCTLLPKSDYSFSCELPGAILLLIICYNGIKVKVECNNCSVMLFRFHRSAYSSYPPTELFFFFLLGDPLHSEEEPTPPPPQHTHTHTHTHTHAHWLLIKTRILSNPFGLSNKNIPLRLTWLPQKT